jgi:hypothetical protein
MKSKHRQDSTPEGHSRSRDPPKLARFNFTAFRYPVNVRATYSQVKILRKYEPALKLIISRNFGMTVKVLGLTLAKK